MTEIERPEMTNQRLKDLILDHYQIAVVEIKALPAYLGRNYYLRDDQNSKYVFKISLLSEQEEIIQFENQVMSFLIQELDKSGIKKI